LKTHFIFISVYIYKASEKDYDMRKPIALLLLWISYPYSNIENFALLSKDEQFQNSVMVGLRFKIENQGLETLDNIKVTYFIEKSPQKQLRIQPYHTLNLTWEFDHSDPNYSKIIFNIPTIPSGTYPHQDGYSFGLHYSDWSSIKSTILHYSQPQSSHFTENPNMVVEANSQILFGSAPNNIINNASDARVSAIKPGDSLENDAWVIVSNPLEKSLNLSGLSINIDDNTKFTFSNSILNEKEAVIVLLNNKLSCYTPIFLNIAECMEIAEPLSDQFIISLSYQNHIIQSIPVGKQYLVNEFNSQSYWIDRYDFLKTQNQGSGLKQQFKPGSFFRVIEGENGNQSANWRVYSQNELDRSLSNLEPRPKPISVPDGHSVLQINNGGVVLSWNEESAADSYNFKLYQDEILLESRTIDHNNVLVENIGAGTYKWMVGSSLESLLDNLSDYYTLNVESTLSNQIINSRSLELPTKAARKDTELLVPNWGGSILSRNWDQSRPLSLYPNFNPEESWRCWTVALNSINEYYGGNLTQDEIKHHLLFNDLRYNPATIPDKQLQSFLIGQSGSISPNELAPLAEWVLNSNSDNISLHENHPTSNVIIDEISAGNPVLVWRDSHIMTVDAFMIMGDGKIWLRHLNIDNNGSSAWYNYQEQTYKRYLTFHNISAPRNTNVDVSRDTDGDGIKDFDELYRYNTKHDEKDSDFDGVEDKIEIASALLREKPFVLTKIGQINLINETFADIDNDGIRTENDPDSDHADNTGLHDGQENLNKDFFFDIGESDPFDPDDDGGTPSYFFQPPNGINIHGINSVKLNDGVHCLQSSLSTLTFCSILSGVNENGFSTEIGWGAHVGNTFSKGDVLIRDYANINGDIVSEGNIVKQNNITQIYGSIEVDKTQMTPDLSIKHYPDFYVIPSFPAVTNTENINIKEGQEYTLSPYLVIPFIKVESGGKLILAAGDLYVESIQVDHGAIVEVQSPLLKTNLHINGTFNWKAPLTGHASHQAGHFILIQHSSSPIFLEWEWVGSIFAPWSDVSIGQVSEFFTGNIVGNSVEIHQYTNYRGAYFWEVSPSYALQSN
jgi:hypothetical protein